MHYVALGIVGLIVGAIARKIYPGAQDMGWIMTMALGIAGSYVAGYIGGRIHGSEEDGAVHPAGFLYSIVGALGLIFVATRLHLV